MLCVTYFSCDRTHWCIHSWCSIPHLSPIYLHVFVSINVAVEINSRSKTQMNRWETKQEYPVTGGRGYHHPGMSSSVHGASIAHLMLKFVANLSIPILLVGQTIQLTFLQTRFLGKKTSHTLGNSCAKKSWLRSTIAICLMNLDIPYMMIWFSDGTEHSCGSDV